jgi:hypothetical protein
MLLYLIVGSLVVFQDLVFRDALRNKLVNTNTAQIKAAKFNCYLKPAAQESNLLS